MQSQINALIQKLVEKYGTENEKAAIAGQALATLLGEPEETLFEMIEADADVSEDEDEDFSDDSEEDED